MGDPQQGYLYRICVRGKLDTDWSDWFSGLEITSERLGDEKNLTRMTGFVNDQSQLRGILNRIWNLNLTLVSVELVDDAVEQPSNG